MELRLYDTLTREKRPFVPLDPARVRMYVCGPTVYDFAHIGNARPVIVFDVLFRLLQHLAKEGVWDHGKGETTVTYIRNITDVDDKINARAAERGIPITDLTKETYDAFKADVAALGCVNPSDEPRATEYIRRVDGRLDMITLIGRLITNGNAYVEEGHVLFHVPSMPDYGRLSKRTLDEMIAGARVEVAPYKRNPMDFVLWKPSKPGEPSWESPWGLGRPGWHIECSAMSGALLGETFDIHGGGIDLVFPHHENEIAQSRCAFHTPVMANYWMHNGFLQIEGEKMSKSLGNFVTIRELLGRLPGDVIRMQMLMTNYRQPIDWTERNTWLANNEIGDWAHTLNVRYGFPGGEVDREVVEALCDDLNTPAALTVLRRLHSRAQKGSSEDMLNFGATCRFLGFRKLNQPGLFDTFVEMINVESESPWQFQEKMTRLRAAIANDAPQEVMSQIKASMESERHVVEIARDGRISLVGDRDAFERNVSELLSKRAQARKARDWKESDRIRDELAAMGVEIEDHKDGTTTRKVKR